MAQIFFFVSVKAKKEEAKIVKPLFESEEGEICGNVSLRSVVKYNYSSHQIYAPTS